MGKRRRTKSEIVSKSKEMTIADGRQDRAEEATGLRMAYEGRVCSRPAENNSFRADTVYALVYVCRALH